MTAYPKMTAEEWKAEYAEVTREYEELKARGLNLNMASPVRRSWIWSAIFSA